MHPDATCRHCGSELHPNSRSCRKCGSSRASPSGGEGRDRETAGGDPDEFDYDTFVEREFGTRLRFKPSHLSTFWWVAAILVLLSFLFLVFAGLF